MSYIFTVCEYFASTQSETETMQDARMEPITQKHHGFAKRFQSALEEAGAPDTLERLGPWLGVSVGCAWNWRTGEKLPGMRNSLVLAKRLGVCVEWMLTGRGPKRPAEAPAEALANYAALTPQNRALIDDLTRNLLAAQALSGAQAAAQEQRSVTARETKTPPRGARKKA